MTTEVSVVCKLGFHFHQVPPQDKEYREGALYPYTGH